ncbi:MAG: hypothetical protein AUI14_24675 [Actinobacteria bacterium 13_2_20CM_2_71_6]|nr:MAG: hypothetical protein AUI14_24675 [Actinobacteria bacterium 13_2_20CM_2_71_6]
MGAVYSPATGRWTATGNMVDFDLDFSAAALLPDGRVPYAGGEQNQCDPTGETCFSVATANAETYTP